MNAPMPEIIFGFVIGVIARFLMPGPQPMGIIFTTLLGIAGSFVGLTNGDGAISRTTYVPVEYELHFFVQAIILEDKGSGPQRFSFCTSNVIELDL